MKLSPPITRNSPFGTPAPTTLPLHPTFPAIVFQGDHFLRPRRTPGAYLDLDLKTPRLDSIHQHLWLAGLPNAARPLHRQKLIGRSIVITEDPDEHLVWFEAQIFIKPLPDFLLEYDFWNNNLCSDLELRKSACGLLLSYSWLVRHKSDLDIAKECGLLPKTIEWPSWVEFLNAFLDNINLETLSDVNKRYTHGELRLTRLNAIYRLTQPVYSLRNFLRGYRGGSTWSMAFFGYKFKWMLVVFATLSVLLSAFQVGLSTTKLQENGLFQSVSYGFTITSLIVVVAGIFLVLFVWLGLFSYHLSSTWQMNRIINRRRHADFSPL